MEHKSNFGKAYFNRCIIKILKKNTLKRSLDISKTCELGVLEAYEVVQRYAPLEM